MRQQLTNWQLRPWQDDADYAAMLAIRQAAVIVDGIDPASTNEALPTMAALRDSFSPDDHLLNQRLQLATDGEQIAGYATLGWWTYPGGASFMLHGYVQPVWRGYGVGTALLHWGEAMARMVAERENHTGPLLLRGFLSETETAAHALLTAHGYEHYHTMLELDYGSAGSAPSLPIGLQDRPATPADYRAVWEANETVFTGEPQRPAPSEVQFQAFMAETSPDLWVVVWDGSQVAGVALNELWPNGSGEIHQLSVLPAYRRRGLARYLNAASVRLLQTAGAQAVRVTADEDNEAAVRLYQASGFRLSKRFFHYRKPLLR